MAETNFDAVVGPLFLVETKSITSDGYGVVRLGNKTGYELVSCMFEVYYATNFNRHGGGYVIGFADYTGRLIANVSDNATLVWIKK